MTVPSRVLFRMRFLVLSALLAAPHPFFGQSQSDADLMSMNIEDLGHVKVYSASRHLESVQDAPSSVSIITAEEIRRYGWRTLADALRSLRGFYTAYDRQYTSLGVRGFLRPGDYNPRILILVNGHRLNENVYGSAPVGSEFPLDLDIIDHIEVVRGPGSSLFGTNAIFGVMNVITRRPGGESAVELSANTGTLLAREGRVTGFGRKGTTSAMLSASFSRDPGASDLYFPEFDSPTTNNGYAHNMDGQRRVTSFADVEHGEFQVQALFSDRIKKFPSASFGSIFNDPADEVEDVRGYVDASYHHALSAETSLDLRTYYDAYASAGSAGIIDPTTMTRVVGLEKGRSDWLGTEFTLARQFGEQRITAGANFEYSLDVTQKNIAAGVATLFNSSQSPWLAAVYAESELHFLPKVTVHAGAGVDEFDVFGVAFSPRVAVIYEPNSKNAFKYIFGRAFRAPNAYEEYYADDITIIPHPEPLQPERIQSNELIFERGLRPWLRFTTDAYLTQLKQLIDEVPDPVSGLTYFANVDKLHSEGLEFELAAENMRGFSGRASYGLSRTGNDQVSGVVPNSPVRAAKLNATLPLTHHAFAGIELQSEGSQLDNQGTRVSPTFLTNVTLSTKPMWGGWEFSGSCYNAFDRRYFSPMGPNDPEAQILQDGRTIRFKVSYRFSSPERKQP